MKKITIKLENGKQYDDFAAETATLPKLNKLLVGSHVHHTTLKIYGYVKEVVWA